VSIPADPATAALFSHWVGPATAFFQVVLIDLTLAGDNAVAVGMAAAGLRREQQRRAIILGLAAAVVMLSGFALIAVWLLNQVGLLLAGGLLLLWVCWRMWRDLRAQGRAREAMGEAALEGHPLPASGPPKSLLSALFQILVADISMSLDNVLAVAGAAKDHPQVLVFGLVLSITLTGFAAAWIARFLHKVPWLGYLGLVMVLYVAGHMIWQGAAQVAGRF
jgi:YjbE family integral membrane protein